MKAKIISALRLVWLRSATRYQAVKNARVKRGSYRCNHCKKLFKLKQIQIDHINAVGTFVNWDTFIERLFCPVDNLRALCVGCHKKKTNG